MWVPGTWDRPTGRGDEADSLPPAPHKSYPYLWARGKLLQLVETVHPSMTRHSTFSKPHADLPTVFATSQGLPRPRATAPSPARGSRGPPHRSGTAQWGLPRRGQERPAATPGCWSRARDRESPSVHRSSYLIALAFSLVCYRSRPSPHGALPAPGTLRNLRLAWCLRGSMGRQQPPPSKGSGRLSSLTPLPQADKIP